MLKRPIQDEATFRVVTCWSSQLYGRVVRRVASGGEFAVIYLTSLVRAELYSNLSLKTLKLEQNLHECNVTDLCNKWSVLCIHKLFFLLFLVALHFFPRNVRKKICSFHPGFFPGFYTRFFHIFWTKRTKATCIKAQLTGRILLCHNIQTTSVRVTLPPAIFCRIWELCPSLRRWHLYLYIPLPGYPS